MQDLTHKLDLWVYLLQQAPVIVVLGVVGYLLLRKVNERDQVIKDKDAQLDKDHQQVLNLYGKAIAAHERGNEIQLQLITVIKELQSDVDKLRDTVHEKVN